MALIQIPPLNVPSGAPTPAMTGNGGFSDEQEPGLGAAGLLIAVIAMVGVAVRRLSRVGSGQ